MFSEMYINVELFISFSWDAGHNGDLLFCLCKHCSVYISFEYSIAEEYVCILAGRLKY